MFYIILVDRLERCNGTSPYKPMVRYQENVDIEVIRALWLNSHGGGERKVNC